MTRTGIGTTPGSVNCGKIPVAIASQSLLENRVAAAIRGSIVQMEAIERAFAMQHAVFVVFAQATLASLAYGG